MPQLLLGLLCVLSLLFGILSTAVMIFRLSCRWTGLERPSFPAASGIVIVSWLAWVIAETIMIGLLQEVYAAAGYPLWEARFVGFFLGLPFHMIVTTIMHLLLMRVKTGKALEVWFVQQLILLAIAVCVGGLLGVGYLLAKN